MPVRPQSAEESQSRPRRPPSTRPSTAAGESSGPHVVAVYEHRGTPPHRDQRAKTPELGFTLGIGREIGVATLNRNTGQVSLLQVCITIELKKYFCTHNPWMCRYLMAKHTSGRSITSMFIIPQLLLFWTHLSLPILLRAVRHPHLCNICRTSSPMSSLSPSCGNIGMTLQESVNLHASIHLLILFLGLEFVTQLIVEDEDRAAAILSMTKECAAYYLLHQLAA